MKPSVEITLALPASLNLALEHQPELNPAVAYLKQLKSETSRQTMISPLNRAAAVLVPLLAGRKDAWRDIPWQSLTAAHVRAIMASMMGSPATRRKALAALKGVARASWELRFLDSEELRRIETIKGDSGSRELAGRYVPQGEITRLLQGLAADPSPSAARDGALIAVAATTGARRAELASLDMGRVQVQEDGSYRIKVIGKRDKERTLFIVGNAALSLRDWLSVRGATEGALFCMVRKGGSVVAAKFVSPTALDQTLVKRSSQAGIKDLDWHDLRRTTTSNLLDAGADIATVAALLGHSSVQTTARYDRRGERAKIKAAELVSVPYFQRPASV